VDTDSGISLMLRVRENDQAAFALLYGRFGQRVHSFFYGVSGDVSTSKDLTQETFLRIWKFRARYAATGSILAYLLTFARFVWLEHCRSLRRHGRPSDGPVDELIAGLAILPNLLPDARASRSELSGKIHEALKELPDEQRLAFVLQSIEGLTAEEAASVMQCPIHTARSRKILAVKKLRTSLRGVWDVNSPRENHSEVR
jgi:RNA polymerase sigma-70 factor (ECF subfamily)